MKANTKVSTDPVLGTAVPETTKTPTTNAIQVQELEPATVPFSGSSTVLELPAVLQRLIPALPMAWIEESLHRTQKASRRVRRLPAHFVLWLVILLAIFREQSMFRVAKNLDLAVPCSRDVPLTRSALTQALQRLGPTPIEQVFHQSAACWVTQNPAVQPWNGLSIFAMDGTTFRLPDTPETRNEFGAQRYASGIESSFPQVRCVSLMSLDSRIMVGVQFGPYQINEMTLAEPLFRDVPNHSLVVCDKGFLSARLLKGLQENGDQRHWLIPAKSHTKGKILPGGSLKDFTLEMTTSPQARAKAPWLPKSWIARAIVVRLPDGRSRTLLTSLFDTERYPGEEIAALYVRRWEMETAFLEVKQFLLRGARTLRTRTPDGIRQELWAIFVAYNLLRLRMAEASEGSGMMPTELSPTHALDMIKHDLIQSTALFQERRRQHWLAAPLERRPGRECPRRVKQVPRRYPEFQVGQRLAKPYPRSGPPRKRPGRNPVPPGKKR